MSQKNKELCISALTQGQAHLIEANAGTGKTYAIANLFLRFVLEGINIQNMLVVTFTRAATDELRGRIRKRLNDARLLLTTNSETSADDEFFSTLPECYPEGESRNQAIQRLALALLNIHEAPIYTIHGFCQQALTDQAFSSGQSFELEQADDSELKRCAMQDWWRQRTYKLDQDELAAFNEMFKDFDSLCNLLEPLLKVPAPVLCPMPSDETLKTELETLADLWKKQGKEVNELLLTHKALSRTQKNGLKPEVLEPTLNEINELLSQQPPILPDSKKLTCIAHNQLQLCFKPTGKDKTDFDCEPFYQAQRLLTITGPLQYKPLITELSNAHDYVVNQISAIKQRQGLLSFDDMIKQLYQALHNSNQAENELANRLTSQYPVILVDEFQDTDTLQYAIFNRIHAASKAHTLIMIGDPKQAIYGFRGGDIFTYMRARREADQHWSLSTNWRSTPEMIDAVNNLFSGSGSFTYEDIPYEPSRPAPDDKRKAHPLTINDKNEPALIVQDLPRKEDGKALSKGDIHNHVHQAVAQRIAELLAEDSAYIGDKLLRPADIAILVRDGFEAKDVRQTLLERGIRAVSVGKDNIWKSNEAIGLRYLLEAALLPDNRNLLRQALTAPFLNLNTENLLDIITTPRRWSNWVELIHKTGTLWQQRGFMVAFQTMLNGLGEVLNPTAENNTTEPTDWLKRILDPERCLTNLLHLSELLQQASKQHPGGEQLLAWMYQQQESEDNEEHQLRLESDEELVKIITMHACKGLEFPVVFAPYLWHCKPADHSVKKSMSWHEQDNNTFHHYYSPWLDKDAPVFKLTDHERLAEDIRLAYVALTRASAHCHVFFGAAGSNSRPGHSGHTALSWLLSSRELDLDNERFNKNVTDVSLEPLTDKPNIAVLPPQQDLTPKRINLERISTDMLDVDHIDRKIRSNWQIGSYSAMTKNVHQTSRATSKDKTDDYALEFEAGAHVGNFLHTLLEHIDPTKNLLPQIKRLTPSLTLRHGLKQKPKPEDLNDWMQDVLHTPLSENGMTLAGLKREHTLHELEFDLRANNVQCMELDTLLREQSEHELPHLNFKDFQGMITGIIDLVFEHEGKYYIADYKSNLLSRRLEDYSADKLAVDISARRYDLQYLIYTLALHRHLDQRMDNYSYERDFGGVYYLFLRAMRPETGFRYGVYFNRPDVKLIKELDSKIFAYQQEKSA